MVVSSVIVKPAAAACQVGADAPLEVNTYPLVPVDPARARVLEMSSVVTLAAAAVVPPIATLFMVDAVVGLMVNAPAGEIATVPVPVGLIATAAFAGLMLVATSSERLFPPPEPHCICAAPEAFCNVPPADDVALSIGLANDVLAVTVVPAMVFAVVFPMVGGADKSNVPPKVKLPLLVTVPDREIPDTVPVPLTLVTVPVVGVA